MGTPEPNATNPPPARVVQGIGPLFTPPYVYVMFPVVVVAAVVTVPLLPVGGGGGPFAMIVPIVVFAVVAALAGLGSMWPMRLTVGADGVRVSWTWIERFISYRELAGIEIHRSARSRGLLFITRGGRRIPVPIQSHVVSLGPRTEQLDAITSLMESIGQVALPIAERVNADPSEQEAVDQNPIAIIEDTGLSWRARAKAAAALGPVDDATRKRL